jgi:hypothetical protein
VHIHVSIESLTHHVSMNLTDYERVIYRLDDVFQVAPIGLEFLGTHTCFCSTKSDGHRATRHLRNEIVVIYLDIVCES